MDKIRGGLGYTMLKQSDRPNYTNIDSKNNGAGTVGEQFFYVTVLFLLVSFHKTMSVTVWN